MMHNLTRTNNNSLHSIIRIGIEIILKIILLIVGGNYCLCVIKYFEKIILENAIIEEKTKTIAFIVDISSIQMYTIKFYMNRQVVIVFLNSCPVWST